MNFLNDNVLGNIPLSEIRTICQNFDKITFRNHIDILNSTYIHVGSSGGEVVKLLACGGRDLGFDSRYRRYDFRDWLSPASKLRYGRNIAKAT